MGGGGGRAGTRLFGVNSEGRRRKIRWCSGAVRVAPFFVLCVCVDWHAVGLRVGRLLLIAHELDFVVVGVVGLSIDRPGSIHTLAELYFGSARAL